MRHLSEQRKAAWRVLASSWRAEASKVSRDVLSELRLMQRQGIVRFDGRFFRVTQSSVYNVPVWEEEND